MVLRDDDAPGKLTPVSEDLPGLEKVLASMRTVSGLVTHGELLGLLRGAWASGLLRECRRPMTVSQLAERLGRHQPMLAEVCQALDAHGVLAREDGHYCVSDAYLPLLDDAAAGLMGKMLAYGQARVAMIESLLTSPEDFWRVDGRQQAAIAEGVTFDPRSRLAVALRRTAWDALPDRSRLTADGARYLELGCGIGGTLLTSLQIFPSMVAVGVELSDRLLDTARSSAAELGLSERVRFVHADAREFVADEPFDVVFWSQFFFPEAAREDVLDVAHRSLRPGGQLIAPLMAEPSVLTDDLHSDDGRDAAMDALVHGSWGVPARGARDLVDEVTAAGFIDAHEVSMTIARCVLATRP